MTSAAPRLAVAIAKHVAPAFERDCRAVAIDGDD